MNLLDDTLETLQSTGKNESDVLYVIVYPGYSVSWYEFKTVAGNCHYDDEAGDEVVSSLKVVGEDWWLEREFYNDYLYSCWVVRKMPNKSSYQKREKLKRRDLVIMHK